MKLSIQNINELPAINEVMRVSQALALVDAIVMPQWEFRFFSFNANWDGLGSEMMGSMRDGSGSEYFINFTPNGVVGKVLADEQLPNALASLIEVPDRFAGFKTEPAFNLASTTFFFWRHMDSPVWEFYPKNLVNFPLLGFLAGGFETYCDWAEGYYEVKINRDVLREVFSSLTISASQLSELNPDLSLEDLARDMKEILQS